MFPDISKPLLGIRPPGPTPERSERLVREGLRTAAADHLHEQGNWCGDFRTL